MRIKPVRSDDQTWSCGLARPDIFEHILRIGSQWGNLRQPKMLLGSYDSKAVHQHGKKETLTHHGFSNRTLLPKWTLHSDRSIGL